MSVGGALPFRRTSGETRSMCSARYTPPAKYRIFQEEQYRADLETVRGYWGERCSRYHPS